MDAELVGVEGIAETDGAGNSGEQSPMGEWGERDAHLDLTSHRSSPAVLSALAWSTASWCVSAGSALTGLQVRGP